MAYIKVDHNDILHLFDAAYEFMKSDTYCYDENEAMQDNFKTMYNKAFIRLYDMAIASKYVYINNEEHEILQSIFYYIKKRDDTFLQQETLVSIQH